MLFFPQNPLIGVQGECPSPMLCNWLIHWTPECTHTCLDAVARNRTHKHARHQIEGCYCADWCQLFPESLRWLGNFDCGYRELSTTRRIPWLSQAVFVLSPPPCCCANSQPQIFLPLLFIYFSTSNPQLQNAHWSGRPGCIFSSIRKLQDLWICGLPLQALQLIWLNEALIAQVLCFDKWIICAAGPLLFNFLSACGINPWLR